MKLPIPEYIKSIAPYVPGKPIEELEREYGISNSIKLASNENPIGPSPMALAAVAGATANLHRYPDGAGFDLVQGLSRHLQVKPEQIVIGNGSDDLLGMLARVLLQPGDEVVVPTPSFLMYTIVTNSAGAVPVMVPLKDLSIDLDAVLDHIGPQTRIVFLCTPNNPTGTILPSADLEAFLTKVPPEVLVVVDEAYFEFVRQDCASGITFMERFPMVVTLRTFSKAYGLAGLRVGYGVMDAALAELLNRIRMPFNVNVLAQIGASAALEDTQFISKTLSVVHQGLDYLYAELDKRGLRYFPSEANFFLIDVGQPAKAVFERLLTRGVIVRSMHGYGFPQYIRLSVGLPEENRRFLDAIDQVL